MKLSEKQRKKRKSRTILCVIEVIVILIAIVALFLFGSGIVSSFFPAITIDGKNYRRSEFQYYYLANYNSYLDTYSEYTTYMFDQEKSLKEQPYSNEQTWYDYFTEGAVDIMTRIIGVASEAKKQGFELSKEDQKKIAETVEDIKVYAKTNQVDPSKYLETLYGTGMNLELYEKHLTYSYLASSFSNHLQSSYAFEDQEIEDYYNDNLQLYTYANYERFYVKVSDTKEEPQVEAKQAALDKAEEIHKRIKQGEELKELGQEYKEYGTYYAFDAAYYDASFSYGEWLFSKERKQGDSTIIDDGAGYYVMVYHSTDASTYKSVDIFDVFLEVDLASLDPKDLDYENKKNQLYEDSCIEAEQYCEEWITTGEPPLEGKVTKYEQLTKDILAKEVDKWSFDPKRKPGDCSVLYSEKGFHAVYYLGDNIEAWKVKAETNLQEEAFKNWYDTVIKELKVKCHNLVINTAG